MRAPPRLLVADDMAENVEIAKMRLESQGYEVLTAADGEEALEKARACEPDLVLLDIMMPKLDGLEVLRRLKANTTQRFVPVILVTAKSDAKDVVAGLEAGGDDYLTKPFDHAALIARVRAMLRIKALHDTVQRQTEELAALNRTLEARVAQQVADIERMGRLKRFLPPQVAEMIVSAGDERLLESHRREIVVLFCDMRGFTSFAETAEPEEVMGVLQEYYAALGPLVHGFEGTLERFTGDGLIVFFNDPLPCPDPAARAVRLAVAMREVVAGLACGWHKRGYDVGFGVGVAQGYATLGCIGFEGRFEYSVVGTVANIAARLCAKAKDGQVLVSQRVAAAIEEAVETEAVGEIALKGLSRPVAVYNIVALKPVAAKQ